MVWKLLEVDEMDCTMDDCGFYVVINRVAERRADGDYIAEFVKVRADLMTKRNKPIVSFIGTANAVRKHLIKYIADRYRSLGVLSMEHASYIGYELCRAEKTPGYIQD